MPRHSNSGCSDARALPARNFNSVSHMQLNIRVESTSTACVRSRGSIHNHELHIFASARLGCCCCRLLLQALGDRVEWRHGAST